MTSSSGRAHPEDLSSRARRGDLPVEDRQALDRALEGSALLRVAHQVGRDFDEAARVRPGDDELVLRASARALARKGTRRGRHRPALAFGFAAAAVIASGVAFAGAWLSANPGHESPSVPPLPPTPAPKKHTPSRVAAESTGADEASSARAVAAVADPAAPKSSLPPAAPLAHAFGAAAARTPSSAASLFRNAGAKRRSGDLEAARVLYGELERTFPESNEARVSRVSLGKLLLAAGRSREAEQEFGLYLASGGGDLTEEALVGRADALARLGESGEERRVWQELLREHRSSVYAARARQRLDELRATGRQGNDAH